MTQTTTMAPIDRNSLPRNKVRIGMLSLGCPKTLVDSENILGGLSSDAYSLVPSVTDCDVALLNTCSFIQDSKEESIDRILELIELKKEKKIRALVVIGCLVQRYPKHLRAELKEVDAFIGSGDYHKIPGLLKNVLQGERVFAVSTPGYLATSAEARVALTPKHYRYLKISEGCDHICTFCAIPSFRGRHRSRSIEDIVNEAEELARQGAKELILTGQDTTYFGRDFTGEFMLPDLLARLDNVKGVEWLRLLYAYPSCITDKLISGLKKSRLLCRYLDMPLQHASDPMLTAMKRGISKDRTYDLIKKLRDAIPGLAMRTTFIVGFPGETEKDFKELLKFMEDIRFERLGIFIYSQEDNTPAEQLPNQVPQKLARERFEQAMELQQIISTKNNETLLGQKMRVLIDEKSADENHVWIGRTHMDAPEVDGSVFVHSKKPIQTGEFYSVRVTATKEYDLVAEI